MRYKKDGKVAIIYTPNCGAGWSTWNEKYKELFMFNPQLVELVLNKDYESLIDEEKIKRILGIDQEEDICLLAYCNLKIKWVDEGEYIHIEEFNGCETIKTKEDFFKA